MGQFDPVRMAAAKAIIALGFDPSEHGAEALESCAFLAETHGVDALEDDAVLYPFVWGWVMDDPDLAFYPLPVDGEEEVQA